MKPDEDARLEDLAGALLNDHADMMTALVSLRKEAQLTQETVAERMAVTQPTVAAFERYDANPTLSTVRRYALAVGARIRTTVERDAECIARPTPAQVSSFHAVPSPKADAAAQPWQPRPQVIVNA